MKTAPLHTVQGPLGRSVYLLMQGGLLILTGPVAEDNAPVRRGPSRGTAAGRQSRLGGCRAGANPAGTTSQKQHSYPIWHSWGTGLIGNERMERDASPYPSGKLVMNSRGFLHSRHSGNNNDTKMRLR